MMNLSYEQAVAKIKEKSTLSEEEISSKIKEKLEKFAGLVSREGAAHILANEQGIKLIDNPKEPSKLKIKNLVAGMQNVEVLTKILAMYPAKQFNSNGREGQVGSMVLGDETGTVRAVLWNEQANKLASLQKDDILRLEGGYVKENRNSSLEIHVNDRSTIVRNPPGETVDSVEFSTDTPSRKLSEITEKDTWVEAFGTVVEVFDLKFFEVCSKCGKRAKPDEQGNFVCARHGSVSPDYSYLVNIFLDDGTASMRVVFFREAAQKFLGMNNDELLGFRESPEAFEPVKNNALSSFVKLNARANTNEMFNRIELIANDVEESSPEEAQQKFSDAGAPAAKPGEASGGQIAETASVETSSIGSDVSSGGENKAEVNEAGAGTPAGAEASNKF